MEKYGFVYIWYDRKRKMFYIGCHWGTEDDAYICSSNRMRDAYRRRPEDFKRKILSTNIPTRNQTFEEEHKWFSFIKEEELGKRYYNLRKHKWGHWTTDVDSKLALSEKISQKTKEAMQKPEIREKYLLGLNRRNNRSSELEVREKRRASMVGKNKGKITVRDKEGNIFHTTSNDPRWISGELISASKGVKRPPLSEEQRLKLKDNNHFKKLNNKKIKCIYCNFVGNPGNIARYHNDKCKHRLDK